MKHDFAFSGLIACGHCGYSIVGEVKKQRYVYYHCTGYKGRCDEPYVREEILEERFSDMLGRLSFDDEVLDWVRDALRTSHADEKREHEAAIVKLRAEYDRLQNRIHAMYVDKLDGKVDGALFDKMSSEWRAEQDRCLSEIERHQSADQSYLEEGVQLLELEWLAAAGRAGDLVTIYNRFLGERTGRAVIHNKAVGIWSSTSTAIPASLTPITSCRW